MSKLFELLLKSRGLNHSFLQPKYESLSDPFDLLDMDKAISRIKKAIQNREKIIIYGDYDVDGVTASTLMFDALTLAGVNSDNISIMLPDRFADGYGMNSRLIDNAKKQGANLIITVDCGSRNYDIIDELNNLKIDTIITDHHECDSLLPKATAVINPKRKDFIDDQHGLKNLAGVGVAFKLAQGLVKEGLIPSGQEKWLLDLVLIGTICDNMLLTGENRILGYYGVKVLEKTRRIGLRELMSRARVKKITAESIGFQIGPRLNSAGRLKSAELSLNLVQSKFPADAAMLAEQLENLNKQRKTEQQKAMQEILERGISNDPVIIETGDWHEGVLGIIAGHLVEEFHRPAFALSEIEGGVLKGSGRSFGEFNLAEALKSAEDTIINGGGHAGAAGVKLNSKDLPLFREQVNKYYLDLHLSDQEKYLQKHADLDVSDLSELSLQLLDELKLLEPFGAGNEEPIFRLKDIRIINITRMGSDQNHLRLDIKDQNGHNLKLISFFAPEQWFLLTTEDKIMPLIKLIENDYNGIKTVEARIIDINVL